ncbi:MAG: A/G-specific adenine glycosylase [Alphaproteobacteria bacterium]|nr:A/G-specific adenine glycosylase [Alphaproteobacteria bacterium]
MHGTPTSAQSRPTDRSQRLLAWYDVHRRHLPWRAPPGQAADPYHVWLSEIMLQQTTVQAVATYYRKFLRRWTTVESLAVAPLDEVLGMWAGLGYYARARNLHKAAQAVAAMGGRFPATAAALRELPGVGTYTAGAIAAIAFGAREAAMDANAERVIARLFAVSEPLPSAKPRLLALGRSLVPERRPGDFAQALMDLGAAICTVKRPACERCPLADDCEARPQGIAEMLPVKGAKPVRPLKRGAAFVALKAGAVLLEKRAEKGLLGGMLQPPQGLWGEKFPAKKEALAQAPFPADWKKLPGVVRHGFTHFELEIEVWLSVPIPAQGGAAHRRRPLRAASLDTTPTSKGGKWVPIDKIGKLALPTVMRKIIAHALPDEGPLFRSGNRGA